MLTFELLGRTAIGLIAACLLASSNYILNGILDAKTDQHHPRKGSRPLVTNRIRHANAMCLWLLLGTGGLLVAAWVGILFLWVSLTFQLMALVYNIPPVRLKDVTYVDVVTEAANCPLRLLMGWSIVIESEFPSLPLLLAAWAAGGTAMAYKRLSELREFDDLTTAVAYRRSFIGYSEHKLLVSTLVYLATTIASGFSALPGMLSISAR